MLRWCDPYSIDVPPALVDRTGYVFEEAERDEPGGPPPDRLAVEAEDLPPAATPAMVIAEARVAASRFLAGGGSWREGQVDTPLGPAHTLAIAGGELEGELRLAALRAPDRRMWRLRYTGARANAGAVFQEILERAGEEALLPAGWAQREAFGEPLALPGWLRPPRVFRFVSADESVVLLIDQGGSDMADRFDLEVWARAEPGELVVVHLLASGPAPLAGAAGERRAWRLDRCDAYGGVVGSTWVRTAWSPALRITLVERESGGFGDAHWDGIVASAARR